MRLLDEREVAFLKRLNDDPIWMYILKKMSEFSATPRYKRGADESSQVSDWKYESGRLDERESLISLLTLSQYKIKLENSK